MGIDQLRAYLPFLIPYVAIEFALMIVALAHVFRHNQYRVGNRVLWVLLVVFVQILGPIAYFAFGKGDE